MNSPRDHRGWRAELAAHMLGSLESDEREAVERHLEDCERCREEVRWLQPAIDLLPESVAQIEPPAQLRERLLAEVQSESAPAKPAPSPERGGLRRFFLRPAVALAGVALIAAAVAGYALNGGGEEKTTTVVASSARVDAKLERSGDSGTLQLTGLRQAPSSHVYQAWVQRGGGIHPSSLFDARKNGRATVALPNQLAGARAVMVTVEPRGGSRQPTGSPLINLKLSG